MGWLKYKNQANYKGGITVFRKWILVVIIVIFAVCTVGCRTLPSKEENSRLVVEKIRFEGMDRLNSDEEILEMLDDFKSQNAEHGYMRFSCFYRESIDMEVFETIQYVQIVEDQENNAVLLVVHVNNVNADMLKKLSNNDQITEILIHGPIRYVT